jgi:cyd operon protein YbgT
MWYFAWLLGLPLAALFAVVNAMWLEAWWVPSVWPSLSIRSSR